MNENVPCIIFSCSLKHPYCTTLLLQSFLKGALFLGSWPDGCIMSSITKSLELAVSFRIFKIKCKLIGWVFVLFWGGFILPFSYWSLTRLCREIPSSVPKIDKRMLSILVYCNVNLYWWKQFFVPFIKTLVSFSHLWLSASPQSIFFYIYIYVCIYM